MKVTRNGGVPEIQGLPDGVIAMFFAEITPDLGFCVIYGPEEKCIPRGDDHVELWRVAKVALGKQDEEMCVVDVRHGHKYSERQGGGGMVEIVQEGTRNDSRIFFRRPDKQKVSSIEAVFDGKEYLGGFNEIFVVV